MGFELLNFLGKAGIIAIFFLMGVILWNTASLCVSTGCDWYMRRMFEKEEFSAAVRKCVNYTKSKNPFLKKAAKNYCIKDLELGQDFLKNESDELICSSIIKYRQTKQCLHGLREISRCMAGFKSKMRPEVDELIRAVKELTCIMRINPEYTESYFEKIKKDLPEAVRFASKGYSLECLETEEDEVVQQLAEVMADFRVIKKKIIHIAIEHMIENKK